MDVCNEVSWAVVLPSRVIFEDAIEEMGTSVAKGGLRRPGFGEMISFWLEDGMDRVEAMEVERSAMLAWEGRVNVCVVLPCLIVRVMVSVSLSGGGVVAGIGSELLMLRRLEAGCASRNEGEKDD